MLERPLTREERLDELSVTPSDLVGRDAERADLSAAFHRAMSPAQPSVPPPPSGPDAPDSPPARSHPPASREGRSVPAPAQRNRSSPPPRGEVTARAVVGELGIGKTALCNAFVAELPGGTSVIQAECSPVTSELPFATVSVLLRFVTGMGLDHSIQETEPAIAQMLGPFAGTPAGQEVIGRLAELVTGKQHAHAEEDAANYRRDLVLLGLRHLLAGLAAIQPLVIVVDGLQWADLASLELFRDLLRRGAPLPILLLAVTRPDDRVMPFIEGMVRIELRGLSAEEQIRLVEAHLGVREGVAAVCAELVPRVAGNPFFLLEMVDALLERGTLEIVERPVPGSTGGEGTRLELHRHERPGDRNEALPSTLEQLLSDRLRELPSAERDVVDWLAVAGGPLLESDLLSLTRLAGDEAITRLCARGLCDRKGGALDFRHPLARDVAYLALDPPARARMHRLLGEHLATTPLAQGISAAIVARHLARGEAPGPAAELYLEAASAARAVFQAQLSQRYYQRALGLLPAGDSRRMVAHEALEAIYRHLGRRRERRAHLGALRRLARESGQARWAALALVRTARLDLDEGYLARGLPVAQRAAEVTRFAKKPALEVEALTILSEILRELGDVQGAIDACERALRAAEAGGLAPRARAEVLRAKGVLLRYGGRVSEAVEAYAEAIAVFRGVGARRAEARVKNALAYAMFVLERFEDAVAVGMSSISIDLAIGGAVPDRQDAEQHRAGLRPAGRRRPRARLPAPRPRRPRALRRPGLARRHPPLHGGGPPGDGRRRRRPHARRGRGRAGRGHRQRLRSGPRAPRPRAPGPPGRRPARRHRPRRRGPPALRVAGPHQLPRLRHRHRGGRARRRGRGALRRAPRPHRARRRRDLGVRVRPGDPRPHRGGAAQGRTLERARAGHPGRRPRPQGPRLRARRAPRRPLRQAPAGGPPRRRGRGERVIGAMATIRGLDIVSEAGSAASGAFASRGRDSA